MKKISYICLIGLITTGHALNAMSALKAKQLQIVKNDPFYLLPKPVGNPVGDEAFYQELQRLKGLETETISWIDRALYAVEEIRKLENVLNRLRATKESAATDLAKEKIKTTIIAYAQAALTGYKNNAKANAAYKSENPTNAQLFEQAYNFLKQKSGWYEVEIWWRSTDKK